MDAEIYRMRRDALRPLCGEGVLLFPGADRVPRNYEDAAFPFRQDSHFLYLARVAEPGLALLIGPEEGEDLLFGRPADLDDVLWHGPRPSLEELAAEAGIERVLDVSSLPAKLAEVREEGRSVRYLPPYQPGVLLRLAEILGDPVETVRRDASRPLAAALARLREIKSAEEIVEIEDALAVTREMHREAMRMARPGVRETEIAAALHRIGLERGREQAYEPILTVRGEVLHNHGHDGVLAAGDLLLNDSGAESPLGYASDVTRTCPVGGRFDARQRAIYEIVLAAQDAAIAAAAPGVSFRELHLVASREIARGLRDLGLMRGDPESAVAAGAHALFFPHGLGHMLGLDVHDMEDLGDVVGYPRGEGRSEQFGLSFLRLARELEPGFVFTVEPGIYMIPALIDRWAAEGRNAEFIDFEKLAAWRDFGGIRIEDDVLCTPEGSRVLGPPIEKTVAEVEALTAS